MRWAGLRSNAAVDMFGRGAAVTFILFSSGNAQHAVPRNTLLRRCWSYANNVRNNFPQPWHSVPMASPSVFFPDLREVCITLFNSHTKPARMNNIQKFFEDNTKQTTDPATAFQNPSLNQSKLQTMLFAIYSMLFLEYRTKIGAVRANSQSTMAVVIRNMQLTGPICKKIWAGSTQFTYSVTRRDDGSSLVSSIPCNV